MTSIDFAALAAEFDENDMAGVIERTPDQIEFALADKAFPTDIRPTAKRVVVAGMGGSALPVDVIADIYAGELRSELLITRSYHVPWSVDSDTLVLIMSFSGGTEETLSALDSVENSDAQIVVITAGGLLEKRAHNAGHPLIKIPHEREPRGFQPRCATGYFSTYVARVLEQAGILTGSLSKLEKTATFLRQLDVRPDAERLAAWLGDRIPLVYTDQMHGNSIARITKIKLNENSKRPAFYNTIPEANHNEMIGMTGACGEFGLLFLNNPTSHKRIQKRFDVMRDVFVDRGLRHVNFASWDLPGETHAERVLGGLMFADWWSYYLALMARVNPTPVELVETFKKALNQ